MNVGSGTPRLQFSAERRKQLESTSEDLLEHALNVHAEFHASKKQTTTSKRWKLLRRKKSLNIYRERGTSKTKLERPILCSGVVHGTVEDMINGTYADDTDSMRISLSIMTDKFMDGNVVHVFEKNPVTSSVIFSGIKWMALKMPTSASIIHDRDVLGYHRIGRIVDRRGQYFVYYALHSIDLPEIPANQQRNLERASITLCYLFRQVQDEWVGCFILGNSLMGGSLPRSIGELITAEQMLSVGQFLRVAHAKAYSARMTSSAERMPSTSEWCDVCMKKPNLLDNSHKFCMGCRRKTCKKCRECCTVFRLAPRTQRPEKDIFCVQCVAEVTKPTISTFYMSSLNESTNHHAGSTSVSTGTKGSGSGGRFDSSSPSSSPHSQDFSEFGSEGWLPPAPELPENLDGLASFVERASLADSRNQQWNKQELNYLSDILRESGHYRAPQTAGYHDNMNAHRAQSNHELHPDSREKRDRRMSRSFTNSESDEPSQSRNKCVNVDELD